MDGTRSLRGLSDEGLLSELGDVVGSENEQKAESLRYLEEVERRQLHLRLGYSSLFGFCVERFGMSEPSASKRIGAMRTARRFPVVREMIARGELHLAGLHVLKAHLTEENHRAVLAEATHKTVSEIERIVARIAPKPDVPARVRRIPQRRPRGAAACPEPTLFDRPAAPPPAPAAAPLPRKPFHPKPLSPRSYELRATLDEAAKRDLDALQGLLAHQIPTGDPGEIVKRSLAAYRAQLEKKKAALVESPRATSVAPSRNSRHIPAAIRRAVHERDGGRCSFVGEDGKRCDETRGIELAHVHRPYGKGGEHSVDNIHQRCRAHNRYEADVDYGPLFIRRKIDEARSVREAVAAYG